MSNARTVHRFFEAMTRHDLPALLEHIAADFEFEPILGVLYDRSLYRGHDQMAEWLDELTSRWDAFEGHVEQTREVGDEVAALVRLSARSGDERLDARIGVECRFDAAGRLTLIRGRDDAELADEIGMDL